MTKHGHPVIDVPDAELVDLRSRLQRTRCPMTWPVDGWEVGTDAAELRRLVDPRANDYDWLCTKPRSTHGLTFR